MATLNSQDSFTRHGKMVLHTFQKYLIILLQFLVVFPGEKSDSSEKNLTSKHEALKHKALKTWVLVLSKSDIRQFSPVQYGNPLEYQTKV